MRSESKNSRAVELTSVLPEGVPLAVLTSYFEPLVRKNEKLEGLYLVNFPNADALSKKLSQKFGRAIILKSGGSYRIEKNAFVETDSGSPCVIVEVRLLSSGPNAARVSFEWHQSRTSGAGVVYYLKKEQDEWAVVEKKNGYTI